ncbi:hypothetical protein [Dongia sp.]|uniref:hypothetical protein n=1 Tax=Dongia sp. TaxID=1977262 RepID=UPI0035AF809C
MLRPIPSVSKGNIGKNTQPEEPKTNRKRDGDYEEKLKLAASLHDQGVNPELWQEAEPAPWTVQKRFRETGEAPEDMFLAQGRLYRKSPAIAASRTQGAASLNAFLGETPKPITDLVPVEKVHLRHPLGNKPDNLPAGDAALERYRRYANLGVNPDQAHEGDAIPHHLQDGLKRAVTAADGSEIPLGIPGVYRNPDDGMFYLAHSGTEERDAVKDLRRRLALEKTERINSADPITANDNDPEIDEAVARFYLRELEAPQEKVVGNSVSESRSKSIEKSNQAAAETRGRLEELIQAIELHQKEASLTPRQAKLLDIVEQSFGSLNIEVDLETVNTERLRRIMNLQSSSADKQEELLSTTEKDLAANAATQAAAMGSIATAQLGGGSMMPIRTLAALATEAVKGAAVSAITLPVAVAGILVALTKPVSSPNETTWEALNIAQEIASRPEFSDPDQDGEEEADVNPRNSANDNQPDPANDNDPSHGPNLTVTTAATVAAGLSAMDDQQWASQTGFAPSEKFNPNSQDMRDFQEDFAHAILQGQLPEIWLDGKLLTAPNPGGMLGGPLTRELDKRAAEAVATALDQCRGISNVQQAGGRPNEKQFRIKDIEEKGNKNSVSLDTSFIFDHGDFKCMYHLNTVDPNAKGLPNSRESGALKRMQENIEKIHKLAGSINKNFAHAKTLIEAGYAYDWIKKSTAESDAEINEIIADFMKNVFSCSRIVRECWRTQPMKTLK